MKASYPEQEPNVEALIVDNMNLVKKIAWHMHGRVRSAIEIEDLMQILVKDFSILIVTHNMQQASRVSNYCAFFTTKATDDGRRTGELVEYSDTKTMFTNPSESLTEEYISGRFG